MQGAKTKPKESRIQSRISRKQKAIFERASVIQGRSLSEFIVAAAQEAAERVIQQHEIIKLTKADRKIFFKALRNPPAPNAKLKAAMKRSLELFGPEV
ncbi:hypothetical protein BH09SUM1_BH09SUM1_08200 [soil metagenome]